MSSPVSQPAWALVGGLVLTLLLGLSGLSATAFFIGLMLILTSFASILARRLIPHSWLELPEQTPPRPGGTTSSAPARPPLGELLAANLEELRAYFDAIDAEL
jgi:hypothetical protein